MIETIIFDYGGVFGKSLSNLIYSETAKRTGSSIDVVKSEYYKLRPMIQKGKITMDEFWKVYAQKLNSNHNLVEVVWNNTFENTIGINKKVESIVKKLKKAGYEVALCSNVMKSFANIHRRNKDYSIFEHVIISCDIGMRKPDREIYEFVLLNLAVRADVCVFIDDKIENVEGAEKSGMKGILFENAEQLREELKKCGVRGL